MQLGVLDALRRFGTPRPVADAIGFGLSAQVNFALSSVLTWRDRTVAGGRTVLARLAGYNATALVSLGVNTVVFAALYGTVGDVPAAAGGVVAGMGLTYLGCDRIIFRAARDAGHAVAETLHAESPHVESLHPDLLGAQLVGAEPVHGPLPVPLTADVR